MRKHPLRILIATVVVVYGLLVVTLAFGNSPQLGLDLQGGIAVNLQPVEDGKVVTNAKQSDLDDAIEIIRRRVDALGVAEPEVSRQGSTISVQLPGAKDQAEVLEVVGKTARLEFRPVLAAVGSIPTGKARDDAEARVAELRKELAVPEGVTAQQVATDEQTKLTEQAAAAAGTTTTTAPGQTTTTAPAPPTTAGGDTSTGNGGGRSITARRAAAQDAPTTTGAGGGPTTTAPATTTTTVPPTPLNQWGVDTSSEQFQELYALETQLAAELTPADERKTDAEVTLATEDGTVYRLGPTALDGRSVQTASSGLSTAGEWTVNPVFKGGENGIDKFNEIASTCYSGGPTCPDISGQGRGQLAIVLDDEILSAPSINTPTFSRDQITISGSFDQESADSLAVALRYGSLPIELQPQQAETVSATLGQGALRAGIISGLIGLALVLGYLLLYYRLLGLATIGALSISASLLWIIMSNLGATVTLAGVVGIVASIGISLDSSIVFFENLKEDVRSGATVRSSAERSFGTAYSTILKADISSLIGAAVLYWLSVGPVRGFAFYLGAATLLDLIAAFFFLRPAVVLLARSRHGAHPERFGIPMDSSHDSGPYVTGAPEPGSVPGDAVVGASAAGGPSSTSGASTGKER